MFWQDPVVTLTLPTHPKKPKYTTTWTKGNPNLEERDATNQH